MSALKSRTRADYPFHLPYRTRWTDNDVYAHLNNAIYQHIIDSVVNTYLITHCGLNPSSSPQVGLVVHAECDYFGPISFPSVVEAGLAVVKLGRKSVTYEVGLFEEGHDAVRAVGGFVHVFVEAGSRKANGAMGEGLRSGLEKLVREKGKL